MVKLPRPQIQKYIGQFKLDCSMYNYCLIWYGILLQPNCFLCDIVTFAPSFVLHIRFQRQTCQCHAQACKTCHQPFWKKRSVCKRHRCSHCFQYLNVFEECIHAIKLYSNRLSEAFRVELYIGLK